ncbi:MAG: TIGR01777 family oxidoreductase [Gemmataceae bacterium]
MKKQTIVFRSDIKAPANVVFDWHKYPGAFERYNPPWDPVELVASTGTIKPGATKVLRLWMGPMPRKWVAEHRDYEEGRMFQDVQVSGPFAHWEHTHIIEPTDDKSCILEDRIEYALPMGPVGHWFGNSFMRNKLETVFAYRHRTLQLDIAAHLQRREQKAMKILITGGTGLVGGDLSAFLSSGGHEVYNLTRNQKEDEHSIHWNPDEAKIAEDKLNGFDAVVHLAGESIVGRWSAAKKERILNSRVNGTKLLCEALARQEQPPKVIVSASAIGYYGNRADETMTEESTPGDLFLSDVCKQWEEATKPAADKGIRVVNARIGIVLSPKGGALAQMLFPFRMGGGGVIGSGKQWMSWITLDDVVAGLHHMIETEELRGPVNLVAPNPVTNTEFTKTLGKVLWRPTIFPMPGFAARLVFGQMADELLLASTRVEPTKLQQAGYEFRHSNLEEALRYLLGKEKKTPEAANV